MADIGTGSAEEAAAAELQTTFTTHIWADGELNSNVGFEVFTASERTGHYCVSWFHSGRVIWDVVFLLDSDY
jgi:hypothetical protein